MAYLSLVTAGHPLLIASLTVHPLQLTEWGYELLPAVIIPLTEERLPGGPLTVLVSPLRDQLQLIMAHWSRGRQQVVVQGLVLPVIWLLPGEMVFRLMERQFQVVALFWSEILF
ncbi:hypothetical protein ACSTSJ_005018 [Salmonella enterica subsp. enterica serovar Muenchen]